MNTKTKIVLSSVIGVALLCVLIFGLSGTPSGQAVMSCSNHGHCARAYSTICPRNSYGCCVNGMLGQCNTATGTCYVADLSSSYCRQSLTCAFGWYYSANQRRCKPGYDPDLAPCTNHGQCSQACSDTCSLGEYGCCVDGDLGQCDVDSGYCYCAEDVALCTECREDDGGTNYYRKGTLTNDSGVYDDECDTGTLLLERSCIVPSHTTRYDCSSENKFCHEGACKDCADDDGGMRPFVAGTLIDLSGTRQDICWKDEHGPGISSGEKLYELSCRYTNHITTFDCGSNGTTCSHGQCVR